MTKKAAKSAILTMHAENSYKFRGVMRASLKRFGIWCSAFLMLVQQVAVAQSQLPVEADLDIDPPVIDHEALEAGVAGETQTFVALIIDDRGIEYVDMYYRAAASRDYEKVSMEPGGGSQYIATIPTELAQTRVEYYIEAADTGGNRVLKGFPFFPLVRNLDAPAPPSPLVTTTGNSEPSASGRSSLLYVLVGALAVGLLVSASSGGGDGSGNSGQVPLTINITSPTN